MWVWKKKKEGINSFLEVNSFDCRNMFGKVELLSGKTTVLCDMESRNMLSIL